uniref:Protein kinase domain-containing protein n=1 Tax=Plectus sambesii TaxID=2011161 RepID=A0A914X405_9BILA
MSELQSRETDLASLVPENAIDAAFRISSLEYWPKVEQIGQGAFGKVWKHGTPRKETPFAAGKHMKVQLWNLNKEQKEDLEFRVNSFIREVDVLTKVSSKCHERFVQFIGCYLDSKKLILFTEWMPNGSVKNHIIERPLDETTALKYTFQATQGLHFLHHYKGGRNIHRDIKCDNLLLTIDNNVKLADFGLAHGLVVNNDSYTISQSAPSGFHGTIIYAAPEVLTGETYGRRADIWCVFLLDYLSDIMSTMKRKELA